MQNIPSGIFRQVKDFQGYGTYQNKHYQVLINGLVNPNRTNEVMVRNLSGKACGTEQTLIRLDKPLLKRGCLDLGVMAYAADLELFRARQTQAPAL